MNKLSFYTINLLLLVACGADKATPTAPAAEADANTVRLTETQYKNAGIGTGTLGRMSLSSVLKVSGRIDAPPQNRVSVSVPLGGYLKSTKLLPGLQVRKGEVLAVMEDPQYIQLQQDYLTARADLVYSEAEYNRQRELNQSKASSDKVFESARAAYQKQMVLSNALAQKLQLIGLTPSRVTAGNITKSINIYSPISGFVTAVNVNIGKYVNPADVLFELVNPSDIHLALTVFEKDVNKLAIGQKLLAYTNTDPTKKYPCEILLISRSITGDGATEVHCHFEEYDHSLIPGMFMNADIEVSGNNNAAALPDEAIVRFENKQYVFVMKDQRRFAMQQVEAGQSEGGYTEIIGAEKWAGQSFATKGAYNLLMAMKNTEKE